MSDDLKPTIAMLLQAMTRTRGLLARSNARLRRLEHRKPANPAAVAAAIDAAAKAMVAIDAAAKALEAGTVTALILDVPAASAASTVAADAVETALGATADYSVSVEYPLAGETNNTLVTGTDMDDVSRRYMAAEHEETVVGFADAFRWHADRQQRYEVNHVFTH